MVETRTNQEWLDDLSAEAAAQEAAIAELRDLLLRATLYFFGKNQADFAGLSREEILQRAEDCAQDALIAVMSHLAEFRGDSKFSTWAYKFAINMALMAARRERWKGISLDALAEMDQEPFSVWAALDPADDLAPERSAMQGELRRAIQEVIQHDLTDKQSQVISLMVFHEVPMDEVVRYLGTNRNSVYKLLHDARQKLKHGLQARGFEAGEALALFGTPG